MIRLLKKLAIGHVVRIRITASAMTLGNLRVLSRERFTILNARLLDLTHCVTE